VLPSALLAVVVVVGIVTVGGMEWAVPQVLVVVVVAFITIF